ncbi:hypothetical protein GGR54DRAFT_610398 [Hypoxylon sp. NC1633]|nr:hypothetical protein GGR54DRAFT_610398 [Hypoxylon sp. NC1633]
MAAAPSINSLPYEVRRTIYSLVGRQTDFHYRYGGSGPSIAHYTTVSREWQEEFERYTFRELRVTPDRLQPFSQIITSPRRRAIVQTICYCVSLDRYDHVLDGEPETPAERRRSTQVLTAALGTFLQVMAHWKRSDTSPLGLDLHLLVDSPSDASTLLGRHGMHLVTERALTSYLELDTETLSLPYIDVFSGFRCMGRHLQPMSVLAIVSRLRTLEYLDIELSHDSTRHSDVEQRNNFALNVESYAPAVRVLSLRRPSPLLVPSPAPPRQPWSGFHNAVRAFSQQCESFEFDDCIDATQFFAPFLTNNPRSWSTSSESHSHSYSMEAPFWPHLKRLNVRNSYLMKEPYLRVAGRVEALVSARDVLVAVSRAATRMPELQFARVCQYVLTDGRLEWFILTYERCDGMAVLRARGFVPGTAMVSAWRQSVAGKGLGFDIHVEESDLSVPEL